MSKHSIALIGFRTTGKSLIGTLLARALAWPFVDMDERLVEAFGMDIHAWVQAHGWSSFREAESHLLASLAEQSRQVVATGGGVILDAANRALLKRHFRVIWLEAAPQTIASRLLRDPKTKSQRPALTDLPLEEEIERTLAERLDWYRETADFHLATDQLSPSEVTGAVLGFLERENPGKCSGEGPQPSLG